MRILLRAAGLMRSGPERDLTDDYLARAEQLARGTGFLGVAESAVDVSKAKTNALETTALFNGLPEGGVVVIFDERGKSVTSRGMAKHLANWRDDGRAAVSFIIGPADGFDKASLPPGVTRWSLGTQTWPHKLVRVMAAEQIYRALSILAGTPYHRD